MTGLFNVLNIASACASITGFIAGLYALPSHKRRAALCFFVVSVSVLVFVFNNEAPPRPNTSTSVVTPTVSHEIIPKATSSPIVLADTVSTQESPQQDAPRVRSITGLLYSYSKDKWGGQLMGGNSYPEISLRFGGGLVVDFGTVDWHGSYHLDARQICLEISGLRVPQKTMFGEFYRDAGVGYGVELDNAAFADYSMARVIMLYRTFGGDTPPSQIKKCFPIVPIPSTESGPRIQGEWQGTSTEQDSDQNTGTSMDVRIVQKGNRLYGSLVQTDEGQQAEKSRWEVEGRILDNKVTFMKRNAKRTLVGVSYVAPYTPDARELSGTCFSGLAKGTWTLRYVGEFNDSAEDMLNPATANPPDKP